MLTVIGVGLLYLFTALPNAGPAPGIEVEGTAAQVERGRYLANHVSLCIDCHSERDWSKFSGPITGGTLGMGGDVFDESMGLPGTLYAKNITPANLGDWTDGEIYRVITTGVDKEGEPIFPLMPYRQYRYMDPDDVKAIIAYLRTLEPIDHEVPESEVNFPVNLIIRTVPQAPEPTERPSIDDIIEYGKYMTTIAGCSSCHTPEVEGTRVEELFMAGGFEFHMPGGTVRSANITPHKKNGIGNWSEKQFVSRFKQYDVPNDSLADTPREGFNSVMPWKMYSGMTEQDIKAIYAYLMSLEPNSHRVVKFSPVAQLNTSE